MQRTIYLPLVVVRGDRLEKHRFIAKKFAAVVVACAGLSALTASLMPLQLSIVTVFLFAGPHNWMELRYFMMRLPVRFGRSRNFFLLAFAGIGVLTIAYMSMPVFYSFGVFSVTSWPTVLALWNTVLLLWLALLIRQRGKQKSGSDWSWSIPLALGLCAANWLRPELFSLAIVYAHPLVALWFLDRHLKRNRVEWLKTYRWCLALIPFLLVAMIWRLSVAPSLPDDNGLFWRITQHAGAELLPNVSSNLLVSVHLFLEMLHYGVWIVALPLIAPVRKKRPTKIWDIKTVPLAHHPRGFPRVVATALLLALFVVVVLWFGFAFDYSTTRDIYFTVAIAHVLAEAPFLMKML